MNTDQPGSWFRSLRIWTAVLASGWTLALATLLAWDYHQLDQQSVRLAIVDAQASHARDLAFRRWAAQHGGVYVPVTQDTPPNPRLAHVPARDVVTSGGRQLTLLNSAYISRQVNESHGHPGSPLIRLASLNPLRPEHAPDAWEAEALRALEAGESEILAQCDREGRAFLRLMRPMMAEAQCLKCHGELGYRQGDILGGLSVSVPMENYASAAVLNKAFASVAYSAVWLLGLVGIGTAGLLLDRRVRAQQMADQALRESEHKFRATFNQSFHLAGMLTPDGLVLDVNSCALDFAGIRLVDVVGRPFWETPWWKHDARARRQLRAAIERAAREGMPSRFETTNLHRSGEWRTLDFSLRPVIDELGSTLLLVPEARDITDQKRAEKEKIRLAEELQRAQKLESIGRLAGGVAHDFNNMLTPMMGHADLLLAGKAEDDPDRPSLQAILEAAARARGLTRQLLACSHRQPLASRPMDLNATITDFETLLKGMLREDIVLEVNLQPDIGLMEGDPGQIEQIILNLAVNAQDAMPQGGKIKIRTTEVELESGDARTVRATASGRYLLLSVTDTGIGMEKSVAERAFEPFFTTKPPGKGTGLGLSTAYGIVKQHGGYMEIDTAPGEGTTGRVYFPVSQSTVEISAGRETPSGAPGCETVLVVEDNEQVRRLVCKMLAGCGYHVLSAADGQSALEVAASHPEPVDLLVTDVIMPDMNGKALRHRLAAGRDLDVLYMSGYTADVLGHCEEAHTHFIRKPFSMSEFTGKVRGILDQVRLDRPADAKRS